MIPAFVLAFMLLLSSITLPLVYAQVTAKFVAPGSILYAEDDNSAWNSSSGEFSFGFRRFPGEEDKFLLAIWFAQIPNKTIVWSQPSNPAPRGSKVQFRSDGVLVLQAPGNSELWSTQKMNNNTGKFQAAMLDSGNFVIRANESSDIWESFRHPTNTILPGQVLNLGDKLSSTLLDNNFSKGKFELLLENNELVLQQVDLVTGLSFGSYLSFPDVMQLVFNKTGDISMKYPNNSMTQIIRSIPNSENFYLRVTLDFDGTFTLYSYPKSPNPGESWSIVSFIPDNICSLDVLSKMGSGPCGYNSYCEAASLRKPICGCPPGYSTVDPNNLYSGCKLTVATADFQDCNQEQSVMEQRFGFLPMDGVD